MDGGEVGCRSGEAGMLGGTGGKCEVIKFGGGWEWVIRGRGCTVGLQYKEVYVGRRSTAFFRMNILR